MLLASLVDAGLSVQELEKALEGLGARGFRLEARGAQRGGVQGTQVTVLLEEGAPRFNTWDEMAAAVQGSRLGGEVKSQAAAVLRRLAEGERRAHRNPSGPVHLHELGSLDTLVDIVGVVGGLELLGVQRVYSSPLPFGSGTVRSAHGLLPAPAPATLEMAALAGAPVVPPQGELSGETVTPTGAALLTTLASFSRPLLRLERVGYGLGARDLSHVPNAVALWLGQEVEEGEKQELVLLETNIDDMNPQLYGYVQERLFSLGALDVWYTPIQMKKNRPGVLLSALVPAALEASAVRLLLGETSTLGVRRRPVQRHEAPRETIDVETSLGRVPVKVKRESGKVVGLSPEYEVCRKIALERGLPLQEVLRRVQREAEETLLKRS
jgi:uncharacterized protein (TIGR00299 family) protein